MGNYYTILTNTGQSLLASALTQGTPLKLTQVAFGDGNGSDVTPSASQTALVHEVYRTTINNISVDPSNANWVTIEAILPTTVGGFYIREVGIFDNNNNLIAVGNFPDTYKPNTEEGVGNDLVINIVIEISNTSSVSLTVDPNVVVATTSEVAADIAAHNIDTSSHQDIRSLISGAIASSDASGSIAAHNADTMAHPPIQTTMNAHINNDDGHGVNDKISAHNINIQSHQDIRNEVNNIAPDNVTITKNSNGYWQTSKVLGTAVDNATVVLNSNNQISISPNQPEITSVGSLTNLTVTNPINGSVTGNAGTVTNGVYTTTLNSLVLATSLSGYSSTTGTISTTDTVLSAVEKLNGNLSSLSAAVSGSLVYQGIWDASANSPKLTSGIGTKGYYYKISVAGSTTIDGNSQWNVGDMIVFDGAIWDKIDGISTEVTSVAGRVGSVTLSQSDIAGLTSTSSPTFSEVTAATFNGTLSGNASTATSATTAANVNGVVGISNGGTGLTSIGTANQILVVNSSGNGLTYATPISGGTVTSASVVSANGFAGAIANPTTNPAFTLSTTVTGIVKGNGTSLASAIPGIDYVAPSGSITGNAATSDKVHSTAVDNVTTVLNANGQIQTSTIFAVSATAPANPTINMIWVNITNYVFEIWNGSAWIVLGAAYSS